MKMLKWFCMALVVISVAGCSSTSKKVKNLQLGMTPDEVRDKAGDPFTIRAAKVFEDGATTEVWEYIPRFSLNPKTYWVIFENGKVVQWGEPGDFASGGATVKEYSPTKHAR